MKQNITLNMPTDTDQQQNQAIHKLSVITLTLVFFGEKKNLFQVVLFLESQENTFLFTSKLLAENPLQLIRLSIQSVFVWIVKSFPLMRSSFLLLNFGSNLKFQWKR